MKVLVTGCSGFLGKHIVRHLLGKGCQVVGCQRSSSGLAAPGYAEINGNLMDPTTYERLSGLGIDSVIHCAIITSPAQSDQDAFSRVLDTNINMLLRLLEFCTKEGISNIVNVSSVGVYGDLQTEGLITEDMKLKPVGTYGVSKYISELIITRYHEVYGVKAVSARIPTIYGEYERDTGVRTVLSPVLSIVSDAKAGRKSTVYRPERSRDWTYADDAAEALEALLLTPQEKLKHQVYNVSYQTSYSMEQILTAVQELVPGYSYTVVERIEDANVATKPDIPRSPLSSAALTEDTGYVFHYPIEEGLKKMIQEG